MDSICKICFAVIDSVFELDNFTWILYVKLCFALIGSVYELSGQLNMDSVCKTLFCGNRFSIRTGQFHMDSVCKTLFRGNWFSIRKAIIFQRQ